MTMNSNRQQKYNEVEFRNRPVRITREYNQVWLCLYDLCKIIKRPVMMETKEAINLCPSSTKVIFRTDDKPLWAIAPRDVRKLVHLVKKENSQMRRLCEELETWAGRQAYGECRSRPARSTGGIQLPGPSCHIQGSQRQNDGERY